MRNFVLLSVDAEGAVFAHAALGADEQGVAESGRVDERLVVVLGVHSRGRSAEDAGVRTDLVEAGEPVAELLLYFVKGAYLTDVVESLLAERAPEALHFSASFGVVGLRVEQPDAEPPAGRREHGAAVGRAVVEVERVGFAMQGERVGEEIDHRFLALVVGDAERRDIARGVVEQCVDADGDALAVDDERGPVADVAMPERVGSLGLPAKSRTRTWPLRWRHSRQRSSAKQAPHRALLDAGADASVRAERAKDHRDTDGRMLAADVAEQLAEVGIEIAPSALIGARVRRERGEASAPEGVEPALERGHRVRAGAVGIRRPDTLGAEAAEVREALAATEVAAGELADERMTEERDFFAVISGYQTIHGTPWRAFRGPRIVCRRARLCRARTYVVDRDERNGPRGETHRARDGHRAAVACVGREIRPRRRLPRRRRRGDRPATGCLRERRAHGRRARPRRDDRGPPERGYRAAALLRRHRSIERG